MQNLNFKKEERLCSEILLSHLYKNGSSFLFYPYRITWVLATKPQTVPAQIVISAPKKRFKRSVHRNLIKRRIKEAYRLHKAESFYSFLQDNHIQLLLGVNYIGKEILDFKILESKMIGMLKHLEKIITSPNVKNN